MAETFDSLGRMVGRSVEDIKADIDASVNRVVQASGQNANQIGKLTDLIGRLEGIVRENKNAEKEIKKKIAPATVRIDPRDLAAFEAAAKSFERASQAIETSSNAKEKPVKKEYGGLSEQALDVIGRKLDNIHKAVSGDNLISAAERMLDSLSRKTLNVEDKSLTKAATQILNSLNKRDITAPRAAQEISKEKIPNGFYGSLNRLVKAGLTKGSVYTHDFAAESILTEIMNDIKLTVIALREMAANSGVSKTGNTDLTRLFSEDLRARRLDTLKKRSLVTNDIYERFENRRRHGASGGGGGGGGSRAPGIGANPSGGNPASTFDLDGGTATFNSAAQELVKSLGAANLGLWTKEFARAFGTIPKNLDAAMVEFVDKIIDSGQMTANQLEIAAKSANQAQYMDPNDKRQVQFLIDSLNKIAIELGNARASGSGNVEELEKEFQDKYVQVLNGLIKSYKNLDGTLANFEKRVRDVSYKLYNLQRVVSLLKPSSYGIMPEFKFNDPKAMAKEFGS